MHITKVIKCKLGELELAGAIVKRFSPGISAKLPIQWKISHVLFEVLNLYFSRVYISFKKIIIFSKMALWYLILCRLTFFRIESPWNNSPVIGYVCMYRFGQACGYDHVFCISTGRLFIRVQKATSHEMLSCFVNPMYVYNSIQYILKYYYISNFWRVAV